MKLNSIIAKPQLIRMELNDEDVIKQYGEPLEWWIWDRQPLDRFLKLASGEMSTSDQISATMREMILDEEGKPVLIDDATLPTPILVKILNKMVEVMGK